MQLLFSSRGVVSWSLRWAMSLALCTAMTGILDAQYVIKALPRWMASGHIQYMQPQSPVNRFLDAQDWGYHVQAQYRIRYNKPFMAGMYFSEAGLSRYVLRYVDQTGFEDVRIREKANTRRLEGGVTVGFYPEINWLLQPYVQGRVGLAIYQSSSVLTDRDAQEVIERISESTTGVPSYGLDFGIHIVPTIWYLRWDVRVGFVANPSVSFLALNEADKGDTGYPIDYFDRHTSAGTWLTISAGVSYLF